tara:strand:- start:26 stop:331 length:306 start_codon:yes stop_codon:yes gene_type:complete
MGVASAQHARAGRDGGFALLGHGRHVALQAIKKGDWIVYYCPREGISGGAVVQAFVTLGQVTSGAPYRAAQAMDLNPFRVDVDCLEAPRPLRTSPFRTSFG